METDGGKEVNWAGQGRKRAAFMHVWKEVSTKNGKEVKQI